MAISKNQFNSSKEAVQMLTDSIIDVYFIKIGNGQPRRMHCTLSEKYVPLGNSKTLNSIISKSLSPGSEAYPLVVWDLLHAGWRSFYISTTTEIRVSSYDDTRQMMEDMIEKEYDESEELSAETKTAMVEQFTARMQEKMEMTINNAPDMIVKFSENKIKAWASIIFTSLWNDISLKRSFKR